MITLTKLAIVLLVLGFTTLASAQVRSVHSLPRQLTEQMTKISDKLKRMAWRDHITGKKAHWLAAVALPVLLSTAPVAKAVARDFSPASMSVFSHTRMLKQVAQEAQPSVHYQQEQYPQVETWQDKPANGRSVVLYLGRGLSQTPHGKGSYWTAIHGDGLEHPGSTNNIGIGFRNPRETTHELKLILFNSTAGTAEEKVMREDVVVNGKDSSGIDWIAAWTFQLFGFDRGGIVGPFRYAPLSINIGSSLRGYKYYVYEQMISGSDAEFMRTAGRNLIVGGVLQANLDLFYVGNSVLGVSYLGTSYSLPAGRKSLGGFSHLVTMSMRHGW